MNKKLTDKNNYLNSIVVADNNVKDVDLLEKTLRINDSFSEIVSNYQTYLKMKTTTFELKEIDDLINEIVSKIIKIYSLFIQKRGDKSIIEILDLQLLSFKIYDITRIKKDLLTYYGYIFSGELSYEQVIQKKKEIFSHIPVVLHQFLSSLFHTDEIYYRFLPKTDFGHPYLEKEFHLYPKENSFAYDEKNSFDFKLPLTSSSSNFIINHFSRGCNGFRVELNIQEDVQNAINQKYFDLIKNNFDRLINVYYKYLSDKYLEFDKIFNVLADNNSLILEKKQEKTH